VKGLLAQFPAPCPHAWGARARECVENKRQPPPVQLHQQFRAGGYGRRVAAERRVTLLAESFGCCLALRTAIAHAPLVARMVVVNPGTSFNDSLAGISSLVAATGLLALFPMVSARVQASVRHI
jgi:pimeloyl-ACP methyl ester carboxylesterase